MVDTFLKLKLLNRKKKMLYLSSPREIFCRGLMPGCLQFNEPFITLYL